MAQLGGLEDEPAGLDLRGAFVGSEGTLGIATKIAVRLTPNPPAVRTLLLSFPTVRDAAQTVSDVIAAGVVPAALEVMDQRMTAAVENYAAAGYPTDAAAVLLAEVEGLDGGVERDADRVADIGRANNATAVRLAASEAERAALWKGRKTAFGAVAQIALDYYLHDTVVPRAKLADILEQIYEISDRHDVIVLNVFHAGDGNLHPLLVFDAREEGTLERVHAAGAEILRASLDAGGVLSGEHGIGIEKQQYMEELFSPADLDHQNRLRQAFDPACRANPGKVLPMGHSCADIQALALVPTGVWDSPLATSDPVLLDFAALVGDADPICVRGNGTRWHVGGALADAARRGARPGAVLWDGTSSWALIEGHEVDVDAELTRLDAITTLTVVDGPPPPPHRWTLSPNDAASHIDPTRWRVRRQHRRRHRVG